ncbi:bacitracin ABC transporter permease [Brevibacillus panacihumi W25]|uniref:Bacitracin ABC transporter permease n=1 Tax=Brevibacillus panacihumi W25 TaxID=1408254 RepID=V6MB99_9BACL|nr:undecaprenyl-diphosphatase [Brevibacillus panacihumi]EST55140.1 bacitracin ABC transporter permease [Brevibacillus panacihumi W25]
MELWDINTSAFRSINDLGKTYSFLDPVFYTLAEHSVFLLAFAVLCYWFTRRNENRMMVISAGISFILAEILAKIAGMIHYNSQPFAELPDVHQLVQKAVNNSFPSDHTILFFTFCFTFWLFGKRFRLVWLLLACCVAISRIGVGVHYPFDVLTGALFGMISAIFAYKFVPGALLTQKLLAIYNKAEQAVLPGKDKAKEM